MVAKATNTAIETTEKGPWKENKTESVGTRKMLWSPTKMRWVLINTLSVHFKVPHKGLFSRKCTKPIASVV